MPMKSISGAIGAALASLLPFAAFAQTSESMEPRSIPLLHWLLFAGLFILTWCIFYFLLYPYFLRHLRSDVSKRLFWILFLLYALTWIHLSLYLMFDYGFYFLAIRWVGLAISVVGSLWLMLTLLSVRE